MGIATFLIAFAPTYETIGIWGAVILTVLRMLQGIGVGGEWGGSARNGMVASLRPARPGRVLAAIRRAVRHVPGESRGARLQHERPLIKAKKVILKNDYIHHVIDVYHI